MIAAATFTELLELEAVQRSFAAVVLASLGLPIAGVLIVGLDVITARFAVMHLALLGTTAGLFLGIDPVLSALAVSCIATGALTPLATRPGGLSGSMGLLMTMAIGSALLLLSITGVNATGAFEFLWGSVLATRGSDLVLIGIVSGVVAGFTITNRKRLALVLYDREIALTSGIAVGPLLFIMLVLVAASIASAIRLTGALLVDSLTLLPALTARNLATSFRSMLGLSVAAGLLTNVGGLTLALATDMPPGPVLVLVAGSVTLASFLVPTVRKGST
ncbi:MAG: metal ABC transporter permease [Microthrixaceae bacterium]